MATRTSVNGKNFKKNATRRLHRDILELERTPLPSIAAKPLESNIFEWHVNISPLEGVYSEIYFHLIMKFPNKYPMKPPTIRICTPIAHPNIFGGFLCLSMLRDNTNNHPYEGWSCSYSITSILMQLQSFLFAERIEQDSGYIAKAYLCDWEVKESIEICKSFKCSECGHTHSLPYPKVIKPARVSSPLSLSPDIRIRNINNMRISGVDACKTIRGWGTVCALIPIDKQRQQTMKKIYYEATVTWNGKQGSSWFGFGTENTTSVGDTSHSFSYGGKHGKYAISHKYNAFGEPVKKNDTIVCALDFVNKRIYYAKNGKILEPKRVLQSDQAWQYDLYPMATCRDSGIKFNFGQMSKPCQFLIDRNFVCLDERDIKNDDDDDNDTDAKEAEEEEEEEETSVSDDSAKTDTEEVNPSDIRICGIHADSISISALNSCRTNGTQLVSGYANSKINREQNAKLKIYYEATITWAGSEDSESNTDGELARFGFGNEHAMIVGADGNSFGYGGNGTFYVNKQSLQFGEAFSRHDTIACALDFGSKRVYFAKNGKILEPARTLRIDDKLWEQDLRPMVTYQNSQIRFNFGRMSKPCSFLIEQQFVCLDQFNRDVRRMNAKSEASMWHNEGIIDEIWLSMFESLEYHEIYRCKFVCKAWNRVINKFNIMDRNHIYCYFSKQHYNSKNTVLGIGLNICVSEESPTPVIQSQMDYLSLNVWRNGLRDGVWGEQLTHFLPLVINRAHSEHAHESIMHHLRLIAEIWPERKDRRPMYSKQATDRMVLKSNATTITEKEKKESAKRQEAALKLIDIVITMMNQLVVKFVMDNKEKNNNQNVEMVFCDKVVLGYCLFHHLLLYLTHCFEREEGTKYITNHANNMVRNFLSVNGTHKSQVPDLGKFLIYSMLSDRYQWSDFAALFVYESFTRRVLWIVRQYPTLNNTFRHHERDRLRWSLESSMISRRLVMFQCWFMLSNKDCTLKEYNSRLGRPSQTLRNNIQSKTRQILQSNTWQDYLEQLHLKVENNDFHQLLLFAVVTSYKFGYHRRAFGNNPMDPNIRPPRILYVGERRRARVKSSNASKKAVSTRPNAWSIKAGALIVGAKTEGNNTRAPSASQGRGNNAGGTNTRPWNRAKTQTISGQSGQHHHNNNNNNNTPPASQGRASNAGGRGTSTRPWNSNRAQTQATSGQVTRNHDNNMYNNAPAASQGRANNAGGSDTNTRPWNQGQTQAISEQSRQTARGHHNNNNKRRRETYVSKTRGKRNQSQARRDRRKQHRNQNQRKAN